MPKKLLYTIIGFTFIFVAAAGIFPDVAAAKNDTASLDAALTEKGYPQIVLDTLSKSAKADIDSEEGSIFNGAVISYFDKAGALLADVAVSKEGDYTIPSEQISSAGLILSLICSRIPSVQETVPDQIKITCSYEWLSPPQTRWQDPICVLWDKSLFRMPDDGFSKTDQYDGYMVIGGVIVGKAANRTHSSENSFASSGPAGVAWFADLKGYIGIWPSALYGYGTFTLIPVSSSCSVPATLSARYLHMNYKAGSHVTIKTPENILISGGKNYTLYENRLTISW